jgi:hypothetical protein
VSLFNYDSSWGEEMRELVVATAELGLDAYETLENLHSITLQIRPTHFMMVQSVVEGGIEHGKHLHSTT